MTATVIMFTNILNEILEIIGSFSFDWSTWPTIVVMCMAGSGTAILIRKNKFILPRKNSPDLQLGSVGDMALGFLVSFLFNAAGSGPVPGYIYSTTIVGVADWARKKYSEVRTPVEVLEDEITKQNETLVRQEEEIKEQQKRIDRLCKALENSTEKTKEEPEKKEEQKPQENQNGDKDKADEQNKEQT